MNHAARPAQQPRASYSWIKQLPWPKRINMLKSRRMQHQPGAAIPSRGRPTTIIGCNDSDSDVSSSSTTSNESITSDTSGSDSSSAADADSGTTVNKNDAEESSSDEKQSGSDDDDAPPLTDDEEGFWHTQRSQSRKKSQSAWIPRRPLTTAAITIQYVRTQSILVHVHRKE